MSEDLSRKDASLAPMWNILSECMYVKSHVLLINPNCPKTYLINNGLYIYV